LKPSMDLYFFKFLFWGLIMTPEQSVVLPENFNYEDVCVQV
jgi:hypothetical protein